MWWDVLAILEVEILSFPKPTLRCNVVAYKIMRNVPFFSKNNTSHIVRVRKKSQLEDKRAQARECEHKELVTSASKVFVNGTVGCIVLQSGLLDDDRSLEQGNKLQLNIDMCEFYAVLLYF